MFALSVLLYAIVCLLADESHQEIITGLPCVPVTQCPVLFELLKKRPVTADTVNFIRTSNCGFDGMVEKVWCPNIRPLPDERLNETIITKSQKLIDGGTTEPSTLSNDSSSTRDFKKIKETTDPVQPIATYLGVDPNASKEESLFPADCGGEMQDKIFGGTATDIDAYPWTALLKYENRRTKKLYNGCGGTLLNKRYVLTAAHCITTRSKPVEILLGEYDTRNETDCVELPFGGTDCAPPPIRASVESIDVHPEWLAKDRRPFYHDIALIRLKENVDFSDFVSPICLPRKNYTPWENSKFICAGWGRTEKRESTYVKQQVVLPLVENTECTKILKKEISEGQMCAGGEDGKDACIGDSGGPLMTAEKGTGIWIIAGVVSLSLKGCGIEGIPGIYTAVSNYLDWIHETVKP